jgi:hypothetical protein
MKKNKAANRTQSTRSTTPSARIVVMLLGNEVVHLTTDGARIDCVVMQLDSGTYDDVGRPSITLQRDRASVDRQVVAMAFELSDQTPTLPPDSAEGKRSYEEYRRSLEHGKHRNN